jgi:hypothetical protein
MQETALAGLVTRSEGQTGGNDSQGCPGGERSESKQARKRCPQRHMSFLIRLVIEPVFNAA